MQEKEIWKDIEGYNGDYQVSNMGRVRSFKGRSVRVLKGALAGGCRNHKYRVIALTKNSKSSTTYIHRLVAKYFCKKNATSHQVDHINGDKHDNRAMNLRWVTRRQNVEGYHAKRSSYGCGVYKSRNGRFYSQTTINGKSIYHGTYDTPEQARQARQDFKTKHNLK